MAANGILEWSPRLIERNDKSYEKARLRSNKTRVRDIVAFMETSGYKRRLRSKKKHAIDALTRKKFDMSQEELKLCKLIASLHYEDTCFYRANRSNDPNRPPLKVIVDENLSYKTVTDLMLSGLNFTHVSFDDLNSKPDAQIWWESGAKIIVTMDDDFQRMAESYYLRRAVEHKTEHVDTSDFPFVIIVNKNKIDKDVMLAAFKQLLPDIIGEAMSKPRLQLYGVFQPSGALDLVPHSAVFRKFLVTDESPAYEGMSKRVDQEIEKDGKSKHIFYEVDAKRVILPGNTRKNFKRVADKATKAAGNKLSKRTVSAFNQRVLHGTVPLWPSRIAMARAHVAAQPKMTLRPGGGGRDRVGIAA